MYNIIQTQRKRTILKEINKYIYYNKEVLSASQYTTFNSTSLINEINTKTSGNTKNNTQQFGY